jgi:hypothetical protein
MKLLDRIKAFIDPSSFASVTSTVDDSSGWTAFSSTPHDYDPGKVQEIYADALEAWRKNPIAWRIISITTDYVIADNIFINSNNRSLNKFIYDFWNHPKNQMTQRLSVMCDELSRSGDLFVCLFRNPLDGMSYIRFVTKDHIHHIESAPDDWETEFAYYESLPNGQLKKWVSVNSPDAINSDSVMLHYTINRPLGALLGESDLTTMLPWLLRYSRMLEDRVRLNWAVRSFLWLVTVPANKVAQKREQYRTPPEAGSIVVKDESETWDVNTPLLRGSDARYDLQAVRAMIDAGSGFPPHWRGDAGDISLATAQAMQGPTERHLLRRQEYFVWILEDILYHAYQRSAIVSSRPSLSHHDYSKLFQVNLPDISRFDNESLARSTRDLSQGFYTLASQISQLPPSLASQVVRLIFKFAGESISQDTVNQILSEIKEKPPVLGSPDPNILSSDEPFDKPPEPNNPEETLPS